VSPKAGLDMVAKRKVLQALVIQPIACVFLLHESRTYYEVLTERTSHIKNISYLK
jgi:hypothetical protein